MQIRGEIYKDIKIIKEAAYDYFKKGKYEDALKIIEFYADFMFQLNVEYVDTDIEQLMQDILTCLNVRVREKNRDEKTVLFYDAFGLDTRGLAHIYLKALTNNGMRIIYVVSEKRKEFIPGLTQIVNESGGEIRYISNQKRVDTIRQLAQWLDEEAAAKLILYIMPNSVEAVMLALASENNVKRYLINLVDHGFWLGTNAIDYTIEFRDYGACVSEKNRKIGKEKILKLPYYPVLIKDIEFQGFPFEKRHSKVMFSGGSLYKTYGDNNLFYTMVRKILDKEQNLIFWYAGEGDKTELEKLMSDYEGRVFWSGERKDLYQIMCNIDIYLSTYPMIGGLMTQYAVAAGVIPVTLLHDDCGKGVLIHQNKISFEFKDIDKLIEYVDNVLNNEEQMLKEKSLLENQIITPRQFETELDSILMNGGSSFEVDFFEVDSEKFQQTYLERLTMKKYMSFFFRRGYFILAKVLPIKFFIGGVVKVVQEIEKKYKRGKLCK